MSKLTHIYALTDPDTGEVRYIGKADDPKDRMRKHMLPSALAARCRRTSWLKGLLKRGVWPCMTVIEVVPFDRWKERECFWILFYNAIGRRLVNTTRGGDGGMRSEFVSAETREKQRIAHIGKKQTPESIAKMVATRIGVPRKPETIAKMSAAHKGKVPSPQCLEARNKALVGKKHSPELVARRTAHMKGNLHAAKYQYIATNPDGIEYEFASMGQFCAAHGLDRNRMTGLAKGDPKRITHKGWLCRYK